MHFAKWLPITHLVSSLTPATHSVRPALTKGGCIASVLFVFLPLWGAPVKAGGPLSVGCSIRYGGPFGMPCDHDDANLCYHSINGIVSWSSLPGASYYIVHMYTPSGGYWSTSTVYGTEQMLGGCSGACCDHFCDYERTPFLKHYLAEFGAQLAGLKVYVQAMPSGTTGPVYVVPPPDPDALTRRKVFLIPGIQLLGGCPPGYSNDQLGTLRTALIAAGIPQQNVIIVGGANDPSASPYQASWTQEQKAEYLKALIDATTASGDAVDLVGYSEGGVVGLRYHNMVAGSDDWRPVHHFIALGSPFAGSYWADAFFPVISQGESLRQHTESKDCLSIDQLRELTTGDSLKRNQQLLATPPDTATVSGVVQVGNWSLGDLVVAHESSTIAGTTNYDVVGPNHLALPGNKAVQQFVAVTLTAPDYAPPKDPPISREFPTTFSSFGDDGLDLSDACATLIGPGATTVWNISVDAPCTVYVPVVTVDGTTHAVLRNATGTVISQGEDSVVVLSSQNPVSGGFTVELINTGATGDTSLVTAMLYLNTAVHLEASFNSACGAGSSAPTTLTASISGGLGTLTDVAVTGEVYEIVSEEHEALPLTFLDDGVVPDAVAGDGIYTAQLPSGLVPGVYSASITFAGCSASGGTFSRMATGYFDIAALQDCDGDGETDECALVHGQSDCNANGIPDSCDIANSFSQDLNANGVPDECEQDSDGDGVADQVDICPQTIPGVAVDGYGCPWLTKGDSDRDGDVDAEDVLAFRTCVSGPKVPLFSGCVGMDLDSDGDVDQEDFGFLQRCFSGVNTPASVACAR